MPGRILIAEDEPAIAESLRFLFEREGFEVASAEDGRTAMEMLKSVCPDLVVLDAMMKHVTGFEVLKLLRGDKSLAQPRVLMLTAKGQSADRRLAFELGADDYISKPFSNKEVLASVSRLLDNRKS